MRPTICYTTTESKDFVQQYSKYVSYDEAIKTLKIKDVCLDASGGNHNLIVAIKKKFTGLRVESIYLENVEFSANDLNLAVPLSLTLKCCKTEGLLNHRISNDQLPEKVIVLDSVNPELHIPLKTQFLEIKNSKIGVLRILSGSVKGIRVSGKSVIHEIVDASSMLGEKNPVIDFELNTIIEVDAVPTLRILRKVAINAGDTVQNHIFHTQILDLYRKNESADTTVKWLLFFEKYSNQYGLNPFRPVWLMVLLNTIILTIYLLTNSINLSLFDFLLSSLNVSPLHGFIPTKDPSLFHEASWQVSLDMLRRVLLSILIYQTIIAARRFSFAKK